LQVRLDTLPAESTAELLGALLGQTPELEPLKRMLVKRGNPFFLEETVRTLVETGALVGERGAYRLTRPVEALQVPATVQTILAARIDRLPPEEKQLLQAASVIGKDVPYAILVAIAEQTEEAVRRGLEHLREAEFLYETQLFPELEYTFKHALTHEVAYGGLLQERRRALHARIVEAIEGVYGDRVAEHVERLGHYALRGEMWEKAVTYLRQAGAKAFARSANRKAVEWFDWGLEAVAHLHESRHVTELALDLRLDVRPAMFALGEFERLVQRLGEAEGLAAALGDQRRLGHIFVYMIDAFSMMAQYDRALESGRRALAISDAIEDSSIRVAANICFGMVYYHLGEYRRAVECLEHGRVIPGIRAVWSRVLLVSCLVELGRFADSLATVRELVTLVSGPTANPWSQVWTAFSLGYVHVRRGDLQRATRPLEDALTVCRSTDIEVGFPALAGWLGLAYALGGRLTDALPLLEEGVYRVLSSRTVAARSLFVSELAEGYFLAGRLDEATGSAMSALDLARGLKERGFEGWTLRLLGEIHAHRDPLDVKQAEDSFRQALALGTELGMRPLVAHCHLGLGKLHRRTGQREQAQDHVTTATTMYREMDMGFWLEKAETEVGKLR
jgi:tetratricopeptide (TPR) repeat protein